VNLSRSGWMLVYAFIVMVNAALFPGRCGAQGFVSGEFKLSQEVRWENSVLPMGDYEYVVDSRQSPSVVRVQEKGGSFSGAFTPLSFLKRERTGGSGIVLAGAGNETYVTSIALEKLGGELIFPKPGSAVENAPADPVDAIDSGDAPRETLKFLTIVNPNHEKVPDAEAEKVYLRACEAVEKEFDRPVPIRPRLVLRLGAGDNVLRFQSREILLKKWDENRFADAVVDLALYDMVPAQERVRLSNSAVSRAGATVSVCELKACKN
jgi:hypothetical protein